MKLIQAAASVLALVSIVMYLFENAFSGVAYAADNGASSVAFGWLALAVLCSLVSGLFRVLRAKHMGISKAFILLVAFFVYFTLMMMDSPRFENLKSYTIGTTGGVIFGYLFGVCGALSVQGLFSICDTRRDRKRIISLGVFSLLCVVAALLIVGYLQSAGHLVSTHLLVTDTLAYQRSGNFLSMIFLLTSVAVVGMVFINKQNGKLENWLITAVAVLIYILLVPLTMFDGQLLGSNSVVLFVVATFVPSVVFVFFGLRSRKVAGRRVSPFRLLMAGVLAIGGLIALVSIAVSVYNVDVSNLRILNFGEGGAVPTSVSSRLSLLENDYLEQLSYAPVFGNMGVDELTTGAGTYAHSLPLSLLSHLGIVGFVLFSIFLFLRMRALQHSDSWCGVTVGQGERQKNFQLFVFLVLLAIILAASVSAFFVWMPLWFAVGLLAPPLSVGNRDCVHTCEFERLGNAVHA